MTAARKPDTRLAELTLALEASAGPKLAEPLALEASAGPRNSELTLALKASAGTQRETFAGRIKSFVAPARSLLLARRLRALPGQPTFVAPAPLAADRVAGGDLRAVEDAVQLAIELEPSTQAVKDALQLAIELELSTLPPYLCAMWSIIQPVADGNIVYDAIRTIALNEMAHLAKACNMLAALGGTPNIRDAYHAGIHYPTTGLPGGCLPHLSVDLGSISHARIVNIFQVIETPESEIVSQALAANGEFTIGRFYDALENAALQLDPGSWTQGKQLDDSQGGGFIAPITSRGGVKDAIDTIKLQGEGSPALPYSQGKALAHYYAFEEIAQENKILDVTGDPPTLVWSDVPADHTNRLMPAHYDMIPITEDNGGRYANPPANIQPLLTSFNAAWDALLQTLDGAWSTGGAAGSAKLVAAEFGAMSDLSAAARKLFDTAPDGIAAASNLRYGPEFVKSL